MNPIELLKKLGKVKMKLYFQRREKAHAPDEPDESVLLSIIYAKDAKRNKHEQSTQGMDEVLIGMETGEWAAFKSLPKNKRNRWIGRVKAGLYDLEHVEHQDLKLIMEALK